MTQRKYFFLYVGVESIFKHAQRFPSVSLRLVFLSSLASSKGSLVPICQSSEISKFRTVAPSSFGA